MPPHWKTLQRSHPRSPDVRWEVLKATTKTDNGWQCTVGTTFGGWEWLVYDEKTGSMLSDGFAKTLRQAKKDAIAAASRRNIEELTT